MDGVSSGRRPRSSGLRSAPSLSIAGILLLAFGFAGAGPAGAGPASAIVAGSTVFLNVSTTESISFAPNVLSVQPGQSVHLIVTQLADFNHTFTLSPVANFTFPASDTTGDLDAFFATHVPLVNLSLGSTMGVKFYANFTAPAVGSYEFVCLETDHFAQRMHGELDSGTSSGASASSPSYTLYLVVGVVAVVLIIIAAALLVRRRGKSSA